MLLGPAVTWKREKFATKSSRGQVDYDRDASFREFLGHDRPIQTPDNTRTGGELQAVRAGPAGKRCLEKLRQRFKRQGWACVLNAKLCGAIHWRRSNRNPSVPLLSG